MEISQRNAQKADHFRNLELNYRARAKELEDAGHLQGACRIRREADACQELHLRYKRRVDERYTFWENIIRFLGFSV